MNRRPRVIKSMLNCFLALRSLLYWVLTLWHNRMRLLMYILPYDPFLESFISCIARTFARDIVYLLSIWRILRLRLLCKFIFAEATLLFHQLVLVFEKGNIRRLTHELRVCLREKHLWSNDLLSSLNHVTMTTRVVLSILLMCGLQLHLQSWRGSNRYPMKLFQYTDS